jgi:hypothetical protein
MHEQDVQSTDLAANLASVCGEPARYADHAVGDLLTYHVSSSETRTGAILFVAAPQQIVSSHIPLTYLCDSGNGFPDVVYQSDVIEQPLS